jgi:uncharacterized protein (TIGR01370 family)
MFLVQKKYCHNTKVETKTCIRFVICLLIFFTSPDIYANPNIAFFYGKPVPVDQLTHFEQVVVEPDNIDNIEPLTSKGIGVFAYLSVGEISQSRSWFPDIPKNWLLGENKVWKSSIVDLANKDWQDYVINKQIAPLWDKGYRGFFLDTLDSYQLITEDPNFRMVQQQALVNLIRTMHTRFPGIKLILNRGFEVLPDVAGYAVALSAESLFQRWDTATNSYGEVPQVERDWLLDKLNQVHAQYGLQIIVIDYVSPEKKELAREVAARITALGFTPWVSNSSLDMMGIGSLEVFPRRILALYDGEDQPDGLQNSEVHKLLAMPLEYLGYTLEYVDARKGLPSSCLVGQYAGIVTWFNSDESPQSDAYKVWLSRQLDEGMKVAILGNLGFKADSDFQQRLGLNTVGDTIPKPQVITYSHKQISYKAAHKSRLRRFTKWATVEPSIKRHISLVDQGAQQLTSDPTSQWGSAVLHPYVIETGLDGRQRWLIDPFEFLKRALALPPIPVPDVTTENGKRILMVQIDGDGASSVADMPGTPLAIDVIREQFLQAYPWPTTVSVIEGEVGATGAFPTQSVRLEKAMQDIFKLDNVEIASHSYSHPSVWFSKPNVNTSDDNHQLTILGYSFDLQREITGSVDYINQQLAPVNKQAKVFLWTGDGLATNDALALTKSLGLENMNGGGASITESEPSMTLVPPMGYPINDNYQVYAPIASDYFYTHQWKDHFYGMRQAIETFELTDSPLRLKPIHIHYHFYSGSKAASIDALKDVYNWAAKQESSPITISEYARKITAFQHISVARNQDGAWDIRGLGELRTLRLPDSFGFPNIQKSTGVTQTHELPQGRYVSLRPTNGQALLYIDPISSFSPPAVVIDTVKTTSLRKNRS